jgi:hypothetical protein
MDVTNADIHERASKALETPRSRSGAVADEVNRLTAFGCVGKAAL